MVLYLQVNKDRCPAQEAALLQAAMALFSRNVKEPFHLTLFNLGATNFVEGATSGDRMSIQKAFKLMQRPSLTATSQTQAAANPGKHC